ncbi:MAG: FkbM family methyltransferase [Gemmatimonadales bacterium]
MPLRPRSKIRRSLRKLSKWLHYQYRVSRRTVVTIEEVRVRVGRHMSPGVERAVSKGGYARDELRLIGMVLSPGDVVLEVGAGLGLISAFCAKRLGSNRVFAFEANPDLEPRIRETYALNAVEPTLEMCAIRATAGRVTIYRSGHLLTSSIVRPGDGSRPIEVPGKALSYVVEKVRPTLLLVDLAGAEAELFDRAQLPGVKKIVLELHERVIGALKARRVRAALAALGFQEDPRFSSREHFVLRR